MGRDTQAQTIDHLVRTKKKSTKRKKERPDQKRNSKFARSPSLTKMNYEEFHQLEKQSFFDTNFEKLYNKLETQKDNELEKLVKKTKEMQRSKNNVTSMPNLPDLGDLSII